MTSTYGEGGAGGKVRRHPTRRQQSTPYARPPSQLSKSQLSRTEDGDARAGGWLSRIVDPAYRLISGGATRILPSFFLKSSSDVAPPSPGHDKDSDDDANCDDQDQETDRGSSRLLEEATHDRLEDQSNLDTGKENTVCVDNESGLSEIEQLMRGKLFSRDEANRMTEILHLKGAQTSFGQGEMRTSAKRRQNDPPIDLSENELPRLFIEGKTENLNDDRLKIALSTPVRRPTILQEVGFSPVDIARAYMGSISSGIDTPSRSAIQDDKRHADQKDVFASTAPPSHSKPSICWPGAVVQDHRGYLTPQNPRSRIGLYSSQRSPYIRNIDSKSKLKHQLTATVDRHTGLHVSESLFRQTVNPGPAQGMYMDDAPVNGYRSVGPIRPKKHNRVTQAFRGSTISASSSLQKPIADPGALSVFRSADPGSARNSSLFQHAENKPGSSSHAEGIRTVHPHSSEMARKILDHIDRKVPTLREQSEEIRIACLGQKNSPLKRSTPLQQNDKSALPNGFTSQSNDLKGQKLLASKLFGLSSNSTQSQGGDLGPTDSQKLTSPQFNSSASKEGTEGGKSYISNVSNQVNGQSSLKTSFGAVGSELPAIPKPQQSHSFGNKPALAPVSINKPNLRSGISFGNSSGFSFPVPASSGLFSEPPTPSITPAEVSQEHDEGLSTPSYTFGSKKPSSNLVFSFASASSLSDQVDDSDIKLTFGSDMTSRICFKNTIVTK